MYLSKKDYDFLIHLHDDVFTKKIPLGFSDGVTRLMPLATCIDVEDYVYYINMVHRLGENRQRTNERVRVVVAKRRKIDKNYGRSKK